MSLSNASTPNERKNYMTHRDETTAVKPGNVHCFVCERAIIGDNWFARVKPEEWTIVLCSRACAKAFYTQQLPSLRRLALLSTLQPPRWPRLGEAIALNQI